VEYEKHTDIPSGTDYLSIFLNSPMYIGITLCTIKLISILIARQVAFYQSFQGYKANSELNCLIYSKVLTQSPADLGLSSGEIINLIQWDSARLAILMEFCPSLIVMPIQMIIYNYLLFDLLGMSYLSGFFILILAVLALILSTKFQLRNIKNIAKMKDSRMKICTELINSLKILKLYAWENHYMDKVLEEREEELKHMKKRFRISTMNFFIYWSVPTLLSIMTIGLMQYMGRALNIADILTTVTIFSMLQDPVSGFPWTLNLLFDVLNSMSRIENFLKLRDIDINKVNKIDHEFTDKDNNYSIKVENGNFSWRFPKTENSTEILLPINEENKKYQASQVNDSIVPNVESIPLSTESNFNLKNINLKIKTGELVGIIGEVGSGKSSILQAIFNNLYSDDHTKLEIKGKICYLSQIPWIQNDSLRNNILFQEPYDEIKYRKTLELSELLPDIAALVGGDLTEIGEKGVNLSGGQKARVSLARAIYSNSEIFLFDDIIAALDSHVGQKIMSNTVVNYLNGKTRVIVTHSLQYLHLMDKIVYMNSGEIKWTGPYEDLIKQDFYTDFALKVEKSAHHDEEPEETVENENKNKKVLNNKEIKTMLEEKKEKGSVKFSIYYKYIEYSGGLFYFFLILFVLIIWQGLKIASDLWLSNWARDSELSHMTSEQNWYYFKIYAGIGLLSPIFFYFRMFILTISGLKCSRKLHLDMIKNVVAAPINLFHDVVPKGQILNRFSKDLSSVDMLVFTIGYWYIYLISFIGAVVVCSMFMVYSIAFFSVSFIAGIYMTRFCLYGSRELERLEGIARSPIINQLSETINGAITIRAYEKEETFMSKFCEKVNTYFKIRIFLHGVENFFGFSLDFLSLLFLIFLFTVTNVFSKSFTANAVGLMLSYSVLLQKALFNFLTASTKLENLMVATERCVEYTGLPKEESDEGKCELIDIKGKINFENYSVRYRPNTPLVLKNISLEIQPGEKIGIVGRTGSGKSTICLCLFRILEAESGKILIDDIDLSKVTLKSLRSSLTIIPQDPTLIDGSLRSNIDPLNLYSEDEIREVLKMIGFNTHEISGDCLALQIKENGSNISVGEKQLVCIARAILRVKKYLKYYFN
jgi:ATP-binding cassette, subfamily C (CFTR/MRP), member 2